MRSILTALITSLLSFPAAAANIALIGIFPGKAVLVVEGGQPKTYSVGQAINGSGARRQRGPRPLLARSAGATSASGSQAITFTPKILTTALPQVIPVPL